MTGGCSDENRRFSGIARFALYAVENFINF